MEAKWYCLLLDGLHLRGNDDVEKFLQEQMEGVFGDDFVDIRLIGERITDTSFEIFSESYFFVCCSNYHKYVERIARCGVISLVLPSIHHPEPVDPSSIDEFANSINNVYSNHGDLLIGDIVHIKGGYLENLYGIVVERRHNDQYDVYFRLYSCEIRECLYRSNLIAVGSVYSHLKFPIVPCKNKIAFSLISSHVDRNVVCCVCSKYMMRKPIILGLYNDKMISHKVEKSVRESLSENQIRRKLHRACEEGGSRERLRVL